ETAARSGRRTARRAAVHDEQHPISAPLAPRLMKVHDPAPLVCLASAAARRRELLAQIGVPHVVSAAHLDEALRCGERAADYVVRMARAKALAVRERGVRLPVLAADTTVVLDEIVCGK